MTNEQTNESPIEQAETALAKNRPSPGSARGLDDVVHHVPHTIVDPLAPVHMPSPLAAAALAAELELERQESGRLRARVAELEEALKPNTVG